MMSSNNIPFVVKLEDKYATELSIVGGKGANLAHLYQRGFNVPPAFIITTTAYQFILDNDETKAAILGIENVKIDNVKQIESVSSNIRAVIDSIALPSTMTDVILKYYNELCELTGNTNVHVAVRSSATTEDSGDYSCAGQHDTYLHVTRETLIDKIKECWASLFTTRAISYRKKLNIDYNTGKLALVIQQMSPSEVSGVAFTANPMTGLRNTVIIDSVYGLGEALVSGLVTPDHYEVLIHENKYPEISVKKIGEKSLRIIGKSDGGTETLPTGEKDKIKESLSEENVMQLAQLAKSVENSYNGQPQDIEWSFLKGKFYILQARPITTLFPVPINARGQTDLRCMTSYSTFQGVFDPITPLGESTIRTVGGSFLRVAGVNQMTSIDDDISPDPSRHNIIKAPAKRIYLDVTPALISPLRNFFGMSNWDAGLAKVVNYLNSPKFFQTQPMLPTLKGHLLTIWFFIRFFARVIRNLLFPRLAEKFFWSGINRYHKFIDEGFAEPNNRTFSDCVNHFQEVLLQISPTMLTYSFPVFIPAMKAIGVIVKLSNNPMDALILTRAVQSNPTTEMSLMLWKLSVMIRENEKTLKLFQNENIYDLAKRYKNKSFDRNIQSLMEEYFENYGCRGVGEIDIGRPRWSDEPEHVMRELKAYIKIDDPDKAIDKIHDQSKQSAYEMLAKIENELKWPFIQKPILHFFFKRLQVLFSYRERHKFDVIVQGFEKCRKALLHKANLAVKGNFISNADDIFFLYISELKSLAHDTDYKVYEKRDYWKNLITQRRTEFTSLKTWKRLPLVILSDGRTYYDVTDIPEENDKKIVLKEGEYRGIPVSSGLYEGKVRIVEDPMNTELEAGEIMVCAGTDPAWTPLFPLIGALVIETGGMVQHGVIVSREYGLPAIIGVNKARDIFHNGQRIQVNGSTGLIKVLSD